MSRGGHALTLLALLALYTSVLSEAKHTERDNDRRVFSLGDLTNVRARTAIT